MSTKFEKLIEYVINDEEQKARDLFHEIVVEKSRGIYENLMAEDAKEEELEEAKHEEEEEIEEGMDMEEGMGGDAADELLKDVAYEEEGMTEEEEIEGDFAAEVPADDMGDMSDDMGGEAEEHQEIENTVMNIDSKLDELLAKFEEVIGSEAGAEDADADAEVDFGGEEEEEEAEEEVEESLAEAVQLQKVSVEHGDGKPAGTSAGGYKAPSASKTPVAANAGADVTGSVAQPVKTKGATTNPDGTAAYKAPGTVGNLPDAGKFKNVPAKKGNEKLAPAPAAGKGNKEVGTGGAVRQDNKSPLKGIK